MDSLRLRLAVAAPARNNVRSSFSQWVPYYLTPGFFDNHCTISDTEVPYYIHVYISPFIAMVNSYFIINY